MSAPDWIAVDWGTSQLRIWLMSDDGAVLASHSSPNGMGKLTPADYEPTLLDLIGSALPEDRVTPIVICGMAGARQGWQEAPYAKTPCEPPSTLSATKVATKDARLSVHILPGVSQDKPADVMRGEETQIKGFLASEPKFDGVICLPGTHCKWVHISANEIVSFRTFMTGEVFAALSENTVIKHSMGEGWNADVFDEAVSRAISTPATALGDLFSLRAETLLHGLDPASVRSRLSGLLVGAELAASKPYWLGQDVVILGENKLAEAYLSALKSQGAMARLAPSGPTTLAGLASAYLSLKDSK